MRLIVFILLVAASSGFVPQSSAPPATRLEMERRQVVQGLVGGSVFLPQAAGAFSQQLHDFAYEPQQQATNGKFDLNSAFVVSKF